MLHHSQYADWIIKEVKKIQPSGIKSIQKIAGNKFTIKIKHGGHVLRFRVFLFAVGTAGRINPLERRVEITSTYPGGLAILQDYVDIVLGIEREKRLLVGIDPRRLDTVEPPTMLRRLYICQALKNFLVAVGFRYARRRNYLNLSIKFILNRLSSQITSNSMNPSIGVVSAQPPSIPVDEDIVDQLDLYAVNGSKTKLSYEQQIELALKKMQIGRIGEGIVVKAERKRLSKLNRPKLAKKINWISQTQPYLGYDILSYGVKAQKEYVEVKASVNEVRKFYFTANEMRVAKMRGDSYRLVCVSDVMTQPLLREFRNPIEAIADGVLAVERDTSLVAIKR